MNLIIISATLFVLLSAMQGALPNSANAAQPSFDCTKARAWSELEVCADETLADLDATLASLYRNQKAQLDGTQKEAIIVDQRKWLVDRDRCKFSHSTSKCLMAIYNKRISELSSFPSVEVRSKNQRTDLAPERPSTATAKVFPDAGEFDGIWVGTGKQSNGTVWTIRIEINEGGVQYSVAYPTLNCGGRLLPKNREVNRFEFREQITYGRGACVDDGIMELTYGGNDTLSFSWAYPDGRRGASGQLSRSREEAKPAAADVEAHEPKTGVASEAEARPKTREAAEQEEARQRHAAAMADYRRLRYAPVRERLMYVSGEHGNLAVEAARAAVMESSSVKSETVLRVAALSADKAEADWPLRLHLEHNGTIKKPGWFVLSGELSPDPDPAKNDGLPIATLTISEVLPCESEGCSSPNDLIAMIRMHHGLAQWQPN